MTSLPYLQEGGCLSYHVVLQIVRVYGFKVLKTPKQHGLGRERQNEFLNTGLFQRCVFLLEKVSFLHGRGTFMSSGIRKSHLMTFSSAYE